MQRQKEELHNRIIQLEKQLDAKQALELEIEQLRGSVNVMKHMEDEDDAEILKKVDVLLSDLREKEGNLEDLEALNQTLVVKERNSNDEVQDARKELINASLLLFLFYSEIFLNCWQVIVFSCIICHLFLLLLHSTQVALATV